MHVVVMWLSDAAFSQLSECEDLEDEVGGVISLFEQNKSIDVMHEMLFY